MVYCLLCADKLHESQRQFNDDGNDDVDPV